MKRLLGAMVAPLLILGACAESPDADAAPLATQPTVEATSAEPTSDEIDDQENSEAPSSPDTEEEPTAEAETDKEEPQPEQKEPIITERGNILKEIGEEGGIISSIDPEITFFTFTVTEIVPDFECTSSWSDPSQNGTYVGLKFEVETDPIMAKEIDEEIYFNPYDFKAWDESGQRVNDPIGNSPFCLDESDELPDSFGPGDKASGWIVLDLPTKSGAIALSLLYTEGGWEWYY